MSVIEFCNTPRAEIIRNISFEDYRALPGLNQSLIKDFDPDYGGSPAKFRYRCAFPDLRDSKALRDGRAFHSSLLEPEAFKANYRTMTEGDCETVFQGMKRYGAAIKSKAEYMRHESFASWREAGPTRGFTTSAAFKEWQDSDTREILTKQDFDQIERMTVAILENEEVADEIQGATLDDCEVTVLAPYDFGDGRVFQLKARLDLVPSSDSIIDAKTCRCTAPRKFARDVAEYGYDVQSAHYLFAAAAAGLAKKRFGFLAVEKEPPYLNCIHWMPDEWVKHARMRLKRMLSEIAECVRLNRWPNPSSGLLEPPGWLQSEIELIA